jgi:HK97 gp10 family phage protein
MSVFEMNVKGIRKVVTKFENYSDESDKKSKLAINSALKILVAESKRLMMSGYSTPVFKTGNLFRNIKSKVTVAKKGFAQGRFGFDSSTGYGIYPHDGTYKMKSRPFLTDALINKRTAVDETIKSIFRKD